MNSPASSPCSLPKCALDDESNGPSNSVTTTNVGSGTQAHDGDSPKSAADGAKENCEKKKGGGGEPDDARWSIERLFQNMMEVREEREMILSSGKNSEGGRGRGEGKVPVWLEGTLYRTGPATYSIDLEGKKAGKTFEISHWFDGLGQLQKFTIRDGKVFYRSRNTCPDLVERIKKSGQYYGISFGQDPCKSVFRGFFSHFLEGAPKKEEITDANISVTLLPNPPLSFPSSSKTGTNGKVEKDSPFDSLVLTTDANLLLSVDPTTLEPTAKSRYPSPAPPNGKLAAAHAAVDPRTGEVFNFAIEMGRTTEWTVFGFGGEKDEKGRVLAKIKDARAPAAYLHSLLCTDDYVVLTVWQCDFSLNGASILLNRNVASSFKAWDPNRKTTIFLIPRSGSGNVLKYSAPPFFCFHCINAFQVGNEVIIDYSAYKNHDIVQQLYISNMRKLKDTNVGGVFKRLKVVVEEGKVEGVAEQLFELGDGETIELPNLHPAHGGREYRYAYGTHNSSRGRERRTLFDSLVKISLPSSSPGAKEEIKVKRWYRPFCTPSEPIFIPRPNAEREDDGIVLSAVFDAGKGRGKEKSFLLGLDALSFEEVFRAELPKEEKGHDGVFGLGFHGTFGFKR